MFKAAGIYLGYVGHANLGDEAMWWLCRKRFPSVYWSTYGMATYKTDARQFVGRASHNARYLLTWIGREIRYQRHLRLLADKLAYQMVARLDGEVAILGGGTLINSDDGYLRAYKDLWARTKRPVPVFGSGVTSPEFMADRSGWTDRRREWASIFEALPVVGVRGPISKGLLEEAGAENVVISGDPAVAFHVPLNSQRRMEPTDGRRRIGINCGHSYGRVWGQERRIEAELAVAARELARGGHNIEFLAVCPEDLDSCRRVARQAGFNESSVAPVLSSPKRFVEKARSLDLLVAFKLHAAVLAAAANTPFLTLEYRPKCLDFALSIDWQSYALRTDAASAGQITELISRMLSELPLLRQRLCVSMCRLSAEFEKYCATIEPLLEGTR
jgi:hypothetical protein